MIEKSLLSVEIKEPEYRPLAFSAMLCLYKNNVVIQVKEAIESAFFKQTIPPDELIVVYDGPINQPIKDLVNSYKDKIKVRTIKFDKNVGHGVARAAAVDVCETDWIAIIDADDVSTQLRFEKLLQMVIQYPKTAVIGGGLKEFYEMGSEKKILNNRFYPSKPSELKQMLKFRSPIAQPTSILNVSAVRSVGNYQSWLNNEDYYLWIRLVAAGYELRNISDVLLLFRVSPDLYARRGGLKYWYNEVKLQRYSLRSGTTTLSAFCIGAFVRFFVQVLLTTNLRAKFYRLILR